MKQLRYLGERKPYKKPFNRWLEHNGVYVVTNELAKDLLKGKDWEDVTQKSNPSKPVKPKPETVKLNDLMTEEDKNV